MGKVVTEQIVIGRDGLDDLNREVNDYINNGYQPKDPMLVNSCTDGNQYRYLQTMVTYESDAAPDDFGSWIVDLLRNSGAEMMIESITDEQWVEFWKKAAKVWDEMDPDIPQVP